MTRAAYDTPFTILTERLAHGYILAMALPLVPVLFTAAVCTLSGYVLSRLIGQLRGSDPGTAETAAPDTAVERLVLCPTCGVHVVPAVAMRCDRPGCAAGR